MTRVTMCRPFRLAISISAICIIVGCGDGKPVENERGGSRQNVEHGPPPAKDAKSTDGEKRAVTPDDTTVLDSELPADELNAIAEQAMDEGDFETAVRGFTILIDRDAEDLVAHFGRGIALAELGEHKRAIADFDVVVTADPEAAEIYYVRGLSWFEVDDLDRAFADAERAIKFNEEYADAFDLRGDIWEERGHNVKAAADWAKADALRALSGEE